MNHEPKSGEIWRYDTSSGSTLSMPGPFLLLKRTNDHYLDNRTNKVFTCLDLTTGSVDDYLFCDSNFSKWSRLV